MRWPFWAVMKSEVLPVDVLVPFTSAPASSNTCVTGQGIGLGLRVERLWFRI